MFKIEHGGYFTLKKHSDRPERTVDYYELELCTTNDGKSFFNGEICERKRGDILLSKPGDHRRSVGYFECYYVHFSCNDKVFREKYIDTLPRCIHNANYAEFKDLIQSSVMLSESPDNCDLHSLLASANLARAVLLLNLLAASRGGKTSLYSASISQACSFIDNNFRRNISVDDIADAAMLSPSFTYVQFRKELGMTPHRYLLQKRISEACNLLVFTDKTAAEISAECGFATPNYFNRVFTRTYGITPCEYRKKVREI